MCKQMCLWLPFFWKTPTLYHVFVTLCSLILSLIIIVDSFLLNVLNVFGKWKERMFFCCQWHVQNQPLWFLFERALSQNKANMKSQEGNGTLAATKWHECFKVNSLIGSPWKSNYRVKSFKLSKCFRQGNTWQPVSLSAHHHLIVDP